MRATIRRYQGTGDRTEELTRAVCEIASGLSKLRGFVSCFVLEVEPGVLATVGIFEDLASLEEADRLMESAILQRHVHLLRGEPQTTTGEIVFQRGL